MEKNKIEKKKNEKNGKGKTAIINVFKRIS